MVGMSTVLVQIDPLPDTQARSAVHDGEAQVHVGEDGADVRRHVVRTLHAVLEQGVAVLHQARQEVLQVGAYVGVGVLAQDQGGAGVLDE